MNPPLAPLQIPSTAPVPSPIQNQVLLSPTHLHTVAAVTEPSSPCNHRAPSSIPEASSSHRLTASISPGVVFHRSPMCPVPCRRPLQAQPWLCLTTPTTITISKSPLQSVVDPRRAQLPSLLRRRHLLFPPLLLSPSLRRRSQPPLPHLSQAHGLSLYVAGKEMKMMI